MDITQIVIIVSLLSVTTIVVIVGIWLIKVLQEVKVTVAKTNDILDDAKLITSSVGKPVSAFSEFLMGFQNGFAIFNKFFGKKNE